MLPYAEGRVDDTSRASATLSPRRSSRSAGRPYFRRNAPVEVPAVQPNDDHVDIDNVDYNNSDEDEKLMQADENDVAAEENY